MNEIKEMEEAERIEEMEVEDETLAKVEEELDLKEIVLVVQGKKIKVERQKLALISKFFRALFSHQFEVGSCSWVFLLLLPSTISVNPYTVCPILQAGLIYQKRGYMAGTI